MNSDNDRFNWQALECRVPPVAQVVIVGLAMWALALAVPGARIPAFPIGGILCALAGTLVALLGVWEFRKARTTVDPRTPQKSAQLVVGGIYRLSRNPMYVGFLLILLGWGLYLGHLLAVALLPAFVLYMNRFQIVPEEWHMAARFGAEFEAYASRVRRWL